MKTILSLSVILVLSACVQPTQNPAERAARDAAVMRLTNSKCAIYMGGISEMREVLSAASKKEAEARSLGADDALIAKGAQDAQTTFSSLEVVAGKQTACENFVNMTVTLAM